MSYYSRETETLDRASLKELQSRRLVLQINHVYENNAVYRKKMDDAGIKPSDIHGIDDLHLLPFTTKADLRDSYPNGMLSVPVKDVVEVRSTSGTTGKRVIAYYTKEDLDMWHTCVARALTAAGADENDIVQICYGYGLFTGGAGIDGGAHKIGAMTLPMSSGNTQRQITFMNDLKATVLCCTPSYAAYLAETAKEMGVINDLKLKCGIFGAEAWTESMRQSIEQAFKMKAYDIYGLTELSGPGVAYECECQNGMHINEDFFAVEIIDPDTGEVLPMGQEGELVFTSLKKQAFPVIRYRTRDLCVLDSTPCKCGRTFVRMAKPKGRSDDMLIIRGVNVFPSQIETVLINCGMSANYRIIVDRVNNTDTLDVEVEMSEEHMSDMINAITAKERQISEAIVEMTGIKAHVKLVMPKSIERSEGKAKRVLDRRALYDN